MEYVAGLMDIGSNTLSYLLPFLFVLTIVVFFHELGHFLVARWCGVSIQVFSIGFGPEIFGFYDRRGTRWRFCWIPLGGYVKFLDDENAASVPDREAMQNLSPEELAGSFHAKPLYQRAAVVAAGPIANFLLAIVIFAFMFTFIGQRLAEPRIGEVQPDSAAIVAGFQPEDLVLSIDGQKIRSFNEMQRLVTSNDGQPIRFVVDRGGAIVELVATPRISETTDNFGNTSRQPLLGVKISENADWTLERHDPFTSTGMAVGETWFVISHTMSYLYDVVTGRQDADQLGGPIRIAQVSGQVATAGILALINLSAILSISIGLLNLFPIPMLDGGHLLFYGIEAVRGRPLSERSQEIGFRIGLALVLMLMIFATWNDLVHIKLL